MFFFYKIPKGWKVNEEVELGIIIGKHCKNVDETSAMDYVGGYCVALDMTSTSELVIICSKIISRSLSVKF